MSNDGQHRPALTERPFLDLEDRGLIVVFPIGLSAILNNTIDIQQRFSRLCCRVSAARHSAGA